MIAIFCQSANPAREITYSDIMHIRDPQNNSGKKIPKTGEISYSQLGFYPKIRSFMIRHGRSVWRKRSSPIEQLQ